MCFCLNQRKAKLTTMEFPANYTPSSFITDILILLIALKKEV